MNPKRTWLLMACVLGLFIYISLYERRKPESVQLTGPAARVYPKFTPTMVSGMEIIIRTNQNLRVERTNGNWMLVRPLVAPAYGTRIESLLTVFSQLSYEFHISPNEIQTEKQPLSAFGLDPPQATLIVHQGSNRLELNVGGKTPAGKQVYVQLVGAEGVFLTDPALIDRLPRVVDDWRDPAFLPLRGLSFNRITIETRKGTSSLKFEVGIDPMMQIWAITKPMAARADNRKLAQLLRQFQSWQINRFVPEVPSLDLDSYGLQTPEVVLTFGRDTNDVVVVQFGKSPTNDASLVYARCLPQTNMVLVAKDLMDKLRVPYTEYRDQRLVSSLPSGVDLVEVRADDQFTLQKQKNGDWWTITPPIMRADAELMTNFFGNLMSLEGDIAGDVVLDFATFGLDKPNRKYVLRQAQTNSVTAEVITNRALVELDFGTNQAGKIYARIYGESTVYETKPEAALRLPTRAWQVRDRQIWNFTTNEVRSISITIKGQNRKLLRNPPGQWFYPARPATEGASLTNPPISIVAITNVVLTNILDSALYHLGKLKADSWLAQGERALGEYGILQAQHHVEIELEKGGKPQILPLDFGQADSPIYASTLLPEGIRVIFEFPMRLFQFYLDIPFNMPPGAPPPGK